MTETTKRILELMEAHGDTAYSLERDVLLPISTITKLKKDIFKPSADVVVKVAKYYNVSTDYLLCLTDDPTPPTNDTNRINPFIATNLVKLAYDKDFIYMAKIYNELPNEKREKIYSSVLSIATGVDLI